MIRKHEIPTDGAFSPSYTKLSKEDTVVDGVVTSKSVYVEYQFARELHKQNFQIFGMANLIALGQANALKVGVLQTSTLRNSDKMETHLNTLKNETVKKEKD